MSRKRARYDDEDFIASEGSELEGSELASQSNRTNNNSSAVLQDLNKEEVQRKIKDVVRYALSCEYKRKVIRRDDLTKMFSLTRYNSNAIIAEAKKKLKEVFGFDLVELPHSKNNVDTNQTQFTITQQTQQTQSTQVEASQSLQTQATPSARRGPATGNFVVVSDLKQTHRRPDIIDRTDEEYKLTGVLYLILGIIFLGGQQMTSSALYEQLDALLLIKDTKEFGSREELLATFIKGGYLRKTQIPDADTEEPEYNYTWGPRANVEVGHMGIVSFLSSFYGEDADGEDDDRIDIMEMQKKMYMQAGYELKDET